MVLIRTGDTFSRALVELTTDCITAVLGNIGYAFAEVNPMPEVDREKRTVGINFVGRAGPARDTCAASSSRATPSTADEVLRREMRQFEGAWYSQAAIDRSKVRLQRLGYFETVEVETPEVAGSPTRSTWCHGQGAQRRQFVFGVGYSQHAGLDHQHPAAAEQLPRHRQPVRRSG